MYTNYNLHMYSPLLLNQTVSLKLSLNKEHLLTKFLHTAFHAEIRERIISFLSTTIIID